MSDFTVTNHGSIVLVKPLTDECNDWLVEHVSDEAQWFGGALVVEPRYVEDLIEGLEEAGF